MNVFDLIILVILGFLTLRGVMKGMVSQIVSVTSYLICWIVASRFAFLIAPSIPAEEPWNRIGAMIVLFVVTMIAIRFAHSILEKWVKSLHLQSLNRLLGGTFGFIKGLLLCMVLMFFGVMLSEKTRSVVFESKSGMPLARLIAKTGTFIPADSCEMLRAQIDLFNAKVEGRSTDSATVSTPLFPQSVQDKAGTSLSDLFSRGSALIEEAQSLQKDLDEQKQGAVSLLDGISRWWNGSKSDDATKVEASPAESEMKKPLQQEPVTQETLKPMVASSLVSVPTPPTSTVPPASDAKVFSPPPPVEAPAPPLESPVLVQAPVSSLYQDESIIQRRSAAMPTTAEQLVSLLPSSSSNTATVAQPVETATHSISAMSISRPNKRSFLPGVLSNPATHSSDRLLNSTRTTGNGTSATLFVPNTNLPR